LTDAWDVEKAGATLKVVELVVEARAQTWKLKTKYKQTLGCTNEFSNI
jgi:hypothetical protein